MTMAVLAQEVTVSVARACVNPRSCTATLWAHCKAAVPTYVLCSCRGGRAELTRISLYTAPKVLGISHSVGICDMVNIQDLH